MSKILTLEDRIALAKEAIENDKRIVEDALPSIFDKLIRSPRATWFDVGKLHSVIVTLEGGECRLPKMKRVFVAIVKFLNEQLALEKNVYLKYPKVDSCSFSFDPDGDIPTLQVFFERERFSHLD
jgi:hypothetical protein